MNRLLLTIGLAAMHVCWVYPWSLLLARWLDAAPGQSVLGAWSMLALVLLGALTAWLVIRYVGIRRPGQLALVSVGVLVALLVVRAQHFTETDLLEGLGAQWAAVAVMLGHPTLPALGLLLALVLWYRGVQLGSTTLSFQDAETAFRWNIGALIAFALVLALGTLPSQQPLLEAQATPFVVGAFFVGLLTMAIGRLESLRTRTRSLGLNSQWLGVLIAVAGLLVLLALAVAQVLSFDLLTAAARPIFDLLGQVLVVLLYLIVVPLAYVIEFLVYWLLSLIQPDLNRQPPEPISPGDMQSFLERLLNQALPPEAWAALKAVGAVLVLGVALLLVARAVARWRPHASDSDTTLEERDSVFDAQRLRQIILAWLRGLLRRRRTGLPVTAAHATAGDDEAAATISSVRELYRRLLALGDAAGSQRALATTPYEHQPVLQRTLEPQAHVADITEAYVQVRYAEDEPSDADLADLAERLQRVHPQSAE